MDWGVVADIFLCIAVALLCIYTVVWAAYFFPNKNSKMYKPFVICVAMMFLFIYLTFVAVTIDKNIAERNLQDTINELTKS